MAYYLHIIHNTMVNIGDSLIRTPNTSKSPRLPPAKARWKHSGKAKKYSLCISRHMLSRETLRGPLRISRVRAVIWAGKRCFKLRGGRGGVEGIVIPRRNIGVIISSYWNSSITAVWKPPLLNILRAGRSFEVVDGLEQPSQDRASDKISYRDNSVRMFLQHCKD